MATSNSSNATPKRKRTPSSTMTLSAVVAQVSAKRKISDTDAGKRTRAYIRAHRAELVKVWPDLANHSKGDRYQPMPRKAADALLSHLAK